jgi:hypothetical protein
MTFTVNAKTYSADAIQKDAVGYVGPANTLSVKDQLRMSRVAPKPTSLFSGVARVEAKLTRTLALTGALTPTHDGIFAIPISIPVGAAPADVDAMCTDMSVFVGTAAFKNFVKQQLINQ